MQHPYQRIALGRRSGESDPTLLFAASGPKLVSCDVATGKVLDIWPKSASSTSEETQQGEEDERPGKKRKLEKSSETVPNITELIVTADGRHVVVVTAEDKSVRVLQIGATGQLEELSQRAMPKRPCAISLSPDQLSVLVGDKFGDVYSIPLLPNPDEEAAFLNSKPGQEPKAYTPSASVLTVHSQRNRRALEEQLKTKTAVKTKEPLKFSHSLLLGHVSMLTSMVAASAADPVTGKQKNYILTGDRDEHIRISRGPPQAHIIEGFCLGHSEFVSKLCVLGPNLLVSGGGDDELFLWNWQASKLLGTIDLKAKLAETLAGDSSAGFNPESDIVVSGLWAVKSPAQQSSALSEYSFLAICERLPVLCAFSVSLDTEGTGAKVRGTTIKLPGNPLDVAAEGDAIIVSVDNVSQSDYTKRENGEGARLLALKIEGQQSQGEEGSLVVQKNEEAAGLLQSLNQLPTEERELKAVQELIYGLSNLRKRGGNED